MFAPSGIPKQAPTYRTGKRQMPHTLKYAGAPYDDQAQLIDPINKTTSGPGRALCSCGIISPELESGAARREWFKDHRAKYEPREVPESAVMATRTIEFPVTVAKHFWLSLGHAAADQVRVSHPGLKVEHNDETRTITVTGAEDEVTEASRQLTDLYESVGPAFFLWKKQSEDYKALQHNTLEGRRASYQLTKRFFVGYARHHFAKELL